MRMTDEQIAESRRATERARAVLKPGDRLLVARCGNSRGVTVTFLRFVDHLGRDAPDARWIQTPSLDDVHASHILKVNGVPTSFMDAGWIGQIERLRAALEPFAVAFGHANPAATLADRIQVMRGYVDEGHFAEAVLVLKGVGNG